MSQYTGYTGYGVITNYSDLSAVEDILQTRKKPIKNLVTADLVKDGKRMVFIGKLWQHTERKIKKIKILEKLGFEEKNYVTFESDHVRFLNRTVHSIISDIIRYSKESKRKFVENTLRIKYKDGDKKFDLSVKLPEKPLYEYFSTVGGVTCCFISESYVCTSSFGKAFLMKIEDIPLSDIPYSENDKDLAFALGCYMYDEHTFNDRIVRLTE